MLSALPPDDPTIVVTSSGGAKHFPTWMAQTIAESGADVVSVIHDADIPGQEGAASKCKLLAAAGVKAINHRLPYDLAETHGKDLRDWLNEGHSIADLSRLSTECGVYEPTEVIAPDAATLPTYQRITCRELDEGEFELRYLIHDTLVAGQPLVLAGQHKTLKTTLLIDAAISLATATPFLSRLAVPEAVRVAVMTGESGMATIQETARRVALSKGMRLRDIDGLTWSPDLPRFGDPQHAEALRQYLTDDEIEVLFIDPAYLAMPSADAGNLMAQGELLRPMAQLCGDVGVTLCVAHHAKKNTLAAQSHDPLELGDIAWAGWAEFARQWWLVSRRRKYVEGTGDHALWLSVGGSAGHSALWAVDVSEGVWSPHEPRRWELTVEHGIDTRKQEGEERRAARDRDRDQRQQKRLEGDCEGVLRKLYLLKRPETKSGLKDLLAISGDRIAAAVAHLLESGDLAAVEFTKNNRKENGFEPVQK